MNPEFVPLTDEKPGTIATLLHASYAGLLENDTRWASEQANWDEYDRQVFAHRDTVGACLFLTRVDGQIAGFASWDPRPKPQYGIIGHNCILPQFRERGLGKQQIQEVLRRFKMLGIQTARHDLRPPVLHPRPAYVHRLWILRGTSGGSGRRPRLRDD